MSENTNSASPVMEIYNRINSEFKKVVVGQKKILNQVLITLFSGGHVLIEGVPGLAKTLIVNALSHIISASFKRIQFTPDLMPSDIIGTTVFNMEHGKFLIKKGPVFTNLLLADEINRSPAKTQAALLQVMQENTVNIDGNNYKLNDFFMCMATQNPVEMEGTYPLPEAQIDRFIMKIEIDYPSKEEENEILRNYNNGFSMNDLEKSGILKVITKEDVAQIKNHISKITVDEKIIKYITDIVNSTRNYPGIAVGSSPRGSVALFKTSKVLAAFNGRDYVVPDDVKSLTLPVLRHRLMLEAEAEIEGYSPDDYIKKIVNEIEVPR